MGYRRGFENFSFFERMIVVFVRRYFGTADTVYVLTRRGARAVGLFKAPISIVVLTTTVAAEVEATATVFLFLSKRSEFLGTAWLRTRWSRTRRGIRINLGRFGVVGVANANARSCPESLGIGRPHTEGLVELFGQFNKARESGRSGGNA